jgi:hypothetical protein
MPTSSDTVVKSTQDIRFRKYLYGVMILALIVRLGYFALFHDRVTGFTYEHFFAMQGLNLMAGNGLAINEDQWNGILALQKERGSKLVQPADWPPNLDPSKNYYTAFETPGYAWFLALLWTVVPWKTYAVAKFVQVILGTLLVYPLYDIGRRLFNPHIGLLAAGLYAIWGPSAYLTQVASKDAIEMFVVLVLWGALCYWQTQKTWRLLLTAISFVFLVYFRGNLLPLVGMICVAAIPKFGWKPALRLFLVSYILVGVALIPWYIRNKTYVGRETVLKENLYLTLISGYANYDKSLVKFAGDMSIPVNGQTFNTPDAMVKPVVLKLMKERPLWVLSTHIRRFFRALFFPYEWGYDRIDPKYRSYAAFHQATDLNRLQYFVQAPGVVLFKYGARMWEMIILLLAARGVWCFRGHWKELALVIAPYLGFCTIYGIFIIESRYLVPHTLLLQVLAGIGLCTLIKSCNQSVLQKPGASEKSAPEAKGPQEKNTAPILT